MSILNTIYQDHNEIIEAHLTHEIIAIHLKDGRIVSMPIHWFDWLVTASPPQRANFRVMGGMVYWDELDEGFSIETVLLGKPLAKQVPLMQP